MSTPNEQQLSGDAEIITFPGVTERPEEAATVQATAERLTDEDVATDEVVDGEVVADDELSTELEQRKPVLPPALVSKASAAAPVAKTVGLTTLRHGFFLVGGLWDTASATYNRWTGRDIDAQIQAAKAAGEHGVAADLLRQRTDSKKVLLERMQVWGKFLKHFPMGMASLSGVLFSIVLLASIVAAIRPQGLSFLQVWGGFFDALVAGFEFVTWAASWAPWAGLAAMLGVLVSGYNNRRRRQHAPDWMMSGADGAGRGPEVVVTADGIVRALQKLGIPALNREFKEGWVPQFELTPTREGHGLFKGYRARFSLPDGVPASMIADKRSVLAHNLHRDEIEVWPTDYGKVKGGRRGYLDLYVADAGVMEQPTPEYPLMHTGLADVFAGVPVGINQRGDQLLIPLNGANGGVGGQPGQGKSNLMRVVFAGAALDPLAELRVHVFAGNGDFDEYAPRLSMYDKGADAGHVERAVEHLQELYTEIERREDRLSELGAKKLSRQLAEKHPDLRPLVVGFSECHEMFTSESAAEDSDEEGNTKRSARKLGKEASELAVQVVKRGRKTGIITLYDTQSPRASAIPPALVELLGVNACFYVKSWRNNDGFLGDGSFAAGIRATDLRFNVDKGTCVVTGISEELFEIVRTYYIEADDDTGWDAATDIIARAMQAADPQTPVNGARPVADLEADRNLLEDLDTVLGGETVSAAEAAKALVAQYGRAYHRDGKPITGTALVEELETGYGLKVPSTGNKYPVDPATVRKRLARQSEAAEDE